MKAKQLLRIKAELLKAKKLADPQREAKNIVNFFFTVTKNIKLIEAATSDFDSLKEAEKQLLQTEAAKAYEADRIPTIESFCVKDENGKPKLKEIEINNQKRFEYDFYVDDVPKVNAAIEALNAKYADYQLNLKDSNAAIDAYLAQEIPCELRKLKLREIPSDFTGEMMDVLFDLIETEE